MIWSEDTVREHTIKYLTNNLGIQPKDIAKEFVIPMGRSRKRADIVVFESNTKHHRDNIRIIIECKAVNGSPDEDAIDQLKSYMDATNPDEGFVVRQVVGEETLELLPIEKWTSRINDKQRKEYRQKDPIRWDTTNLTFVTNNYKSAINKQSFPVLSSQVIYYFLLFFAVIFLIVAVVFAGTALTRIETNPTNEDDPLGINEFSTEVAETFVMPTTIPQSQLETSSSLSPETNDANAQFEKLLNDMLNVGWQGIVWIWEFIGSFGFMAQFACCILPIGALLISIGVKILET